MTLVFARRDKNGIVVAADRRISCGNNEYYDTYEKIFKQGKYWITGSGDMIVDHIISGLSLPKKFNISHSNEVYLFARKVLHEVKQTLEKPDYNVIIIADDVIVSFDAECNVEYHDCVVAGCGGQLGRYMIENRLPTAEIFQYVHSKNSSVSYQFDEYTIPYATKKIKEKKGGIW